MKKILSILTMTFLVSACNHVDKHYHYNNNNRNHSYQKYEEYRYNRSIPNHSRTVCHSETYYDAYGRRSIRQVCRTR